MGYGTGEGKIERLGGHGSDAGVDGVIGEDKFGFDLIYVQAKRWERGVSRPDIQGFVGALQGKRTDKGIFITSSYFSAEAERYAADVPLQVIVDSEYFAAEEEN